MFNAGKEPEMATATVSPSSTFAFFKNCTITAAKFGLIDVCLAGKEPLLLVTGVRNSPMSPELEGSNSL